MMSDPATIVVPEVDPRLGACVVFVSIPRAEVIFFKVLLESYEGVAAYRTQNPEHVPGRALVAVLVAPDFAADAAEILAEMRASAGIEPHAASRTDLETLYAVLADSESESESEVELGR